MERGDRSDIVAGLTKDGGVLNVVASWDGAGRGVAFTASEREVTRLKC